jgi:endonuclease/exonuclease/phosphatase (EEP) superfamily protein YafD
MKWLAGLAWAGTIVAIAILVFSWALPQRLYMIWAPYRYAAVASFFGRVFTFHAGVALAVAMIVGLALRRWRLAAVAGIAAVGALTPTFWSLRPKEMPVAPGPTVRVMAMNLYAPSTDDDDLRAQIRAANPDVIVLEEFSPHHEQVITGAFGDRYPFRSLAPCEDPSGMGAYSRLPFVEPPRVEMTNFRRQIRTVVAVDGQPVALYALHPKSPQSPWAIIVNRLQTRDLLKQVQGETIPTILAGDFNFTETTANAAAFRAAGLRSTHDLAGSGRGSTWPVLPRWRAWLPGVRIDHVFLTPQLTCTRDAVGGFDGSDHLPIYADIGLATAHPPLTIHSVATIQ